MPQRSPEKRVIALEQQLAQLSTEIEKYLPSKPSWLRGVGTVTDDAVFHEAMRLGREYRELLRPNAGKSQVEEKC